MHFTRPPLFLLYLRCLVICSEVVNSGPQVETLLLGNENETAAILNGNATDSVEESNSTLSSQNGSNSTIDHDDDHFYASFGELGTHYDVQNKRPYIMCEVSTKFNKTECDPITGQCPTTEQCFLDSNKRTHRLGCMAVFYYEVETYKDHENWTHPLKPVEYRMTTLKGCWHHDKDVLQECVSESACMAEVREASGPVFCCCKTHMCNQQVYVSNGRFEEELAEKDANNEDVFGPRFGDRIFIGAVFFLAILLLIACGVLSVFSYKLLLEKRKEKLMKSKSTATIAVEEDAQLLGDKEAPIVSSVPTAQVANWRHITDFAPVAHGRFGEVFRAVYHINGEEVPVAVKKFPYAENDSWMAEQEIYSLSSLRYHPSIVHYVGAEVHEDGYWLITEYQPNGCLYDYLKDHVLSVEQAMRILITLLDAITYLHEEKVVNGDMKPTVVHRDIKSKNILMRDDLTSCLADFGLAMKCINGMMTTGDGHGQVGTRRYMSPEVLEGATEFSAAAFRQIDVYAAALVMWEVLSRTESYPGEPIPDYKLPYEDEAGVHPSLGEMRECVVARKRRPLFRAEIQSNTILARVAETSREMWDQEADGRITAGCALERLRLLYRDSGTVSEEEQGDLATDRSVCLTTASAAAARCHPRIAEGSLSSAGFNREMDRFEESRFQSKMQDPFEVTVVDG